MSTSKIFLGLLIMPLLAWSQISTLEKKTSKITINGTSTIHDWTSVVEEFDIKTKLTTDGYIDIQFMAKVESIKSEHNGMDNNTYEALKSKQYPEIRFKAEKLESINGVLTGQGQLTIAGKTNNITVKLNKTGNEKAIISGEIPIKMTDYGIEPPVAVFGTIKTGNAVKILLNITLI